jgi:hypothetical protein
MKSTAAVAERDTKIMLGIVLTAIAASIVPLYAMYMQHRPVDVIAGAEDDCRYFYGDRRLQDVIGMDDGAFHYVVCRY